MPAKLDRCVRKVKAQNANKPKGERVNPHAVCSESTGYKRKKGGGWTKKI